MSGKLSSSLPPILCGPILRRVTTDQLVVWWVSPHPCEGSFECYLQGDDNTAPTVRYTLAPPNTDVMQVGKQAFVHLLNVHPAEPLPVECKIEYDLRLQTGAGIQGLAEIVPQLLHQQQSRPSFVIKTQLNRLLHGSCRNPHHHSADTLVAADDEVGRHLDDVQQRPGLLMMSGDQIYADHVAGPMLQAIHQVIDVLGLYDETFTDSKVADTQALYHNELGLYQREKILPRIRTGDRWYRRGGSQPVFTSTYAHNHLISFAEVMAMYLLVWSPSLWSRIAMKCPVLPSRFQRLYQQELENIENFVAGLPQVQRLMAHIPCYMIFDDHDITDDWNLTAQWEQAAYGHPFSRRIIGNTLMGYWLCQGWGNAPEQFPETLLAQARAYFNAPEAHRQDRLINTLLKFDAWHYVLPTSPKVVVLDSRTRRWRSERSLGKPSGLMDWEAMSEMQQLLIGEEAVILVSPAPMFGVKIIETIQHMVTFLGHPLAVDAENWMAHPGTAYTLLQIFKHQKTPGHFVILSGDVHYSFVYDVVLRFKDNTPQIWQITSSGIKNEFPSTLLHWLDKMNRWLYAPYSPLNLFTKRREMKINQRRPVGHKGRRLVNRSGIGLVQLDPTGVPVSVEDLHGDGSTTRFVSKSEQRDLLTNPGAQRS